MRCTVCRSRFQIFSVNNSRTLSIAMVLFSERKTGYRFGAGLLIFGGVLYIIGFSVPSWYHQDENRMGLWMVCGTTCRGHSKNLRGTYFMLVQVLQSCGMIGLGVSLFYGVYVNHFEFSIIELLHRHGLETCACASGVLGFAGSMLFVDKIRPFYYGWAFGINLTGCLIILLSASIIYYSNNPCDDDAATDTDPDLGHGDSLMVQQGQGEPADRPEGMTAPPSLCPSAPPPPTEPWDASIPSPPGRLPTVPPPEYNAVCSYPEKYTVGYSRPKTDKNS